MIASTLKNCIAHSLFTSRTPNYPYSGVTIMEDEYETPEDLYNFEAVGNWRTILQENGQYEKVFVPGDNILKVSRLLLR